MRYIYCIVLSILTFSATRAQQASVKRPALVVGIVVDQMRWDYLYRYYERYGEDGFKRLMNCGFKCEAAYINYTPTFTAPGHACIYTGSVPAIHGIAGNDWIENATGEARYCTDDKTVQSVEGSLRAGKMSPRNMLTTTITDELRLATNMHSKVFGIALKDRGGILPAGHLANGAYWFDDSTGNFISSTYYGNTLPKWLVAFNNIRYADSLSAIEWNTLYPIATYTQSLADNNPYEGVLKGENEPVFPHKAIDTKKGYGGLRYIPGGNIITLKAAKACIKGEALGQGSNTDFLCVSLSSTDYAGHLFAPNAIEVEDMYLRLDKELASFFRYLDRHVGKGAYTVFLTADHGGAHNAKYMQDVKIPAGSTPEQAATTGLYDFVKNKFGKDSLIRDLSNYQVYLNENQIEKAKIDKESLKHAIVEWYKKQDGVAYVIDMEDMDDAVVPEPIKTMVMNGYNRKRSGVIQIILNPAWYSGYGPSTGTTHGSWNPYDSHLPLLWYGWGIPKGKTNRTVHMTDIAATISALLKIQMPNGCVGHVITEITD
ncbi:MAG TPA: alkaline phosphatase PafA [Flavipsychrobacter sp.]